MGVREATIRDVPEIQRVRRSVRENVLVSRAIGDEEVVEYITRRGRGWVAERDGRVVGFAIADLIDRSIWALFVEPAWERRGIGRALHDAMIEWLVAQGVARVTLSTDPGTRAAAFYDRAGWTLRGIDEAGEAVYEKELSSLRIRRWTAVDGPALFDIWLRAVRATHAFLAAEHLDVIQAFVRDYVESPQADLWVLTTAADEPIGFMGMAENDVASLFVDPAYHGRGGGRLLIAHARSLHPELTVSVNEQNEGAVRFYRACGFVVEGRSETDDMGLPYPLVRLRLVRQA